MNKKSRNRYNLESISSKVHIDIIKMIESNLFLELEMMYYLRKYRTLRKRYNENQ
jgi:hypothetical protein